MSGRTVVIIAHRLSTLRHVDEIIVMERGRIVEHGDRSDLAGREGGRFRRLLELALDTEDIPDAVEIPLLGSHGLDDEFGRSVVAP
jgi:ABC-type multidrug transport system ATPase subunit